MKKLIKIAVVLVVLLVITGVVGVLMVDKIARGGIESGATSSLGVDTTLDGASIGLFSGNSSLDKLTVANPEGFESPQFLSLGRGELDASVFKLLGSEVQVERIGLSDIVVNLERRKGLANYQAILDNLNKYESDDQAEKSEGKKFKIKLIELTNVTVHVDLLPEVGDLTKLDVKIPKLTLRDVGSGSDKGAVLGEVTGVLLKSILAAAIEKGKGILPDDLVGDLGANLAKLESLGNVAVDMAGQTVQVAGEEIEKALGGVTKGLDKTVGGAGKDAKKKVDEAFKGLGGLLDKDKDKKKQ